MKRWFVPVILFVSCALPLNAVRAADPIVPVLEVKLQSINELLSYGAYVGALVGQEEQFEQYANAAKAFAGKKGLEGFDPKKPIGIYSGITKDVHDSPIVLALPIVDEKAVLSLLKDKLQITPKEKSAGVYEVAVPQLPAPLYFKFSDGYAHVTIGNPDTLDRVIAPKTFFGEASKPFVSIALHIDRIPDDVKKVIVGQVEFHLQNKKDQLKNEEKSAGKRAVGGYVLDALSSVLKSVLDDGKTLNVSYTMIPTSDDLALEIKLTPKSGSELAKAMATGGKKATTTAGRIAGDHPALAASINFALAEKWKTKLVPVVDDLLNEADANTDPTFAEYLKKFIAAVEPTLKMGELDFAFALNGPNEDGKHKLHAIMKTKKILDLLDAAKEFAKILPVSAIEPKFDIAKVNDIGLHSFTFHEQPGELERLFDTKTLFVAMKDDLMAIGFEPDGSALKTAMKASPESKTMLSAEVAVTRIVILTNEGDKKTKMQKAIKEIYGGTPTHGSDTLKLTATAGSDLTIRLTAKGKTLRVFQAVDKVNKE